MRVHYRTADVEERLRLDYWQSVCSKLIGSVSLKECDRTGFEAAIDLVTIGSLKIGHFVGSSQTLERRPADLRSHDPDDYSFLLESRNHFVFDHCGRQRSGRDGMVFIDLARPYYSRHPERLDVINVFLPRKLFHRFSNVAGHAAGLSFDASPPSFLILANFLRSLHKDGEALESAQANRMTSIACELVAAGLAERIGETSARSESDGAILCRARAFIEDRIDVQGLNMKNVAAWLGVSVRRLHRIAADEGVSLIEWMWDRRLERAKAILADPINRSTPISGVSMRCGFADQAHFSRRFHQKFGMTPTEFRISTKAQLS